MNICFLAFFTQLLRWRRRDPKDKVSEIPQDGWGQSALLPGSVTPETAPSCEQFLDERVFKVITLSHYYTWLFPLQLLKVMYNLMTFIFKCFHQITCRV